MVRHPLRGVACRSWPVDGAQTPRVLWCAAGPLRRDPIWRSLSAEHLPIRQLDPPSDTAKHGPGAGSADSEDCLFLNVYVPADRHDDGGEPLPVLFWIHGGSNEYGEGGSYDPTPLVTQGHIIVVTINYRLGALGWLAHPLLDDGSPNSSGNYGLTDQQFAMRWVNRNIAAFGGDPHKVTIAGESAGAIDSCSHLASPTAAGLFRGAIIESGCIVFQYPQAVLAAVSGGPFVEALGCTTLACIQAAPVSAVLAAELPLGWVVVEGPNIPTLPETPQQAFSDDSFNKVPVI